MQANQSLELTISYTASDSGYTYTRFTFINDICEQTFYASARYTGKRNKVQTLKLTHPNGGEIFVVGSDTVITWEGIAATDTVSLDYSIDNGVSWSNITKEATGLKYEWKNVPKPASNDCLVKVKQLVGGGNTGDTVRTLTGHMYGVYSVAFSPDGSKLASGGWDDTIKIWYLDAIPLQEDQSDAEF